MALCTCLLHNCARLRGNPRLGISKSANRYHFRPGLCCRAWTVVTLTRVKACKTLMLSPGTSLPVEIWWRYMASWKMRYIWHMKRNALVSLADVILVDDVTVVGGKNSFHLYNLCLPGRLCWLSDVAVTTGGMDRLFPIANKQVYYLKTNPSCTAGDYLWWQKGVCEFTLSSPRQCQLGLLTQIKWPFLK